MILYRADRWVVHNHIESTVEVHSSIEEDDWVAEIEHLLSHNVPIRESPTPPRECIPKSETDFEHAEKVRQTQAAIRDGVLYQLNYGRIWSAEIDSPWNLFQRLDRENPAPLSAWLVRSELFIRYCYSSYQL